MELISYTTLRSKYSGALYSHLRITNYSEAFSDFVIGKVRNPSFLYAKELTLAEIEEAIKDLSICLNNSHDEITEKFCTLRLTEYEVLKLLASYSPSASPAAVSKLRRLMKSLYAEPSADTMSGILSYLKDLAERTNNIQVYKALEKQIQMLPAQQLYAPDKATFRYYAKLFRQMFQEELFQIDRLIEELPLDKRLGDYKRIIEVVLDQIGAQREGWRVTIAHHGAANIAVSKENKKVILGRHFSPKSSFRLKQLIVHEVLVHVGRAIHQTSGSVSEEEGLAICAEQLVARRFIHRRVLRYFAASCAWGTDGKPRDFRDTYECVMLACQIIAHKTGHDIERTAFEETTRIYRGGIPAIPGAAYIKDVVYLRENIKLWEELEHTLLDETEFAHKLYGRDTMKWR